MPSMLLPERSTTDDAILFPPTILGAEAFKAPLAAKLTRDRPDEPTPAAEDEPTPPRGAPWEEEPRHETVGRTLATLATLAIFVV